MNLKNIHLLKFLSSLNVFKYLLFRNAREAIKRSVHKFLLKYPKNRKNLMFFADRKATTINDFVPLRLDKDDLPDE